MTQRFMRKVEFVTESGCWLWTGKINTKTGYGIAWIVGQGECYAHRRSWELFKGQIPDGVYVCHRCDVKCCVNPDHLFLGTQTDNMQDAARKGRVRSGDGHHARLTPEVMARGESQWRHLVTEEDVRFIRASTLTQRELAKMFGVKQPTISDIVRRKNWKHVT